MALSSVADILSSLNQRGCSWRYYGHGKRRLMIHRFPAKRMRGVQSVAAAQLLSIYDTSPLLYQMMKKAQV